MNKSVPKNEYIFSLGKKDKVTKYKSKWLIYELDVFDLNGLWFKFKSILTKLETEKKLKRISTEDIDNFYNKNPDIDFEIKFFASLMKKNYLFKINNKMYSYTIGYKSKRKVYTRFYFDLNEMFNDITDD
jgi:hypothetical protein